MVYLLGICLPVILGAIVWWAFTSREIRTNTTYYLDQTFEEAAENFQILAQTAINIANQVNADTSIREDLSKKFNNPVEHYELYWTFLRNRFEMYLVSNPDIASITLYIDDQHFINTDYFRVLDDSTRKSKWYLATQENSSSAFTVYPGSTSIAITPQPTRITVIRKIQSPDFLNNAVNYLLIELRMDRIIAGLKQGDLSTDTYLTHSGDKVFWGTQYPAKLVEAPVLELPPENKYYILQKRSDLGFISTAGISMGSMTGAKYTDGSLWFLFIFTYYNFSGLILSFSDLDGSKFHAIPSVRFIRSYERGS